MSVMLDQTKCIRCKRCMDDCVANVFSIGPDGAMQVNDKHCFHCGHCYAVCPCKAITLDGVIPGQFAPITPAPLTDLQRDMLFKARRSVRQFHQHPVDEAALQRALDLANYAPTARNQREVQWIVLNGRDKMLALLDDICNVLRNSPEHSRLVAAVERGLDPILRGAPCMVLAHAKPWVWAEVDCAAAISYMELALHSQNVGTCWCGYVIAASKMAAMPTLPLPEGHVVYAGLLMGHPSMQYVALPPRSAPPVTYL